MKPAFHTVPFECHCGTVHNSADGKLPVGWTACQGEVWCADCTRAGIASRQIRLRNPHTVRRDKIRLHSAVESLLREGTQLMPRNLASAAGQKRADWVERVNALMAQIDRMAA